MNKSVLTAILTLFLMVFIFYSGAQARDSWQDHMKSLGQALSDLLPLIASEKKFSDPKNKEKISRSISEISHLTHDLFSPMSIEALPPDADPSLRLFLGSFDDELKHAAASFEAGHLDYTRNLLQNISGYCVSCHTRTSQGVHQKTIPLNPGLGKLTQIEMAQYLTATRRFDAALKEYERLISDHRRALKDPLEWQKAVRNALAISVRFKKDPAKTLAILNQAREIQGLPADISRNLRQWAASVQKWQNEAPLPGLDPQTFKTQISKLLAKSKTASEDAYIEFLRASSLAHDYLRLNPYGPRAAEALYTAGLAHASLEEGPVYFMPEMYFEACINESPHSIVAKACYRGYEERLTQSYSGSAGISLPEGVAEQMNRLKKLAE